MTNQVIDSLAEQFVSAASGAQREFVQLVTDFGAQVDFHTLIVTDFSRLEIAAPPH